MPSQPNDRQVRRKALPAATVIDSGSNAKSTILMGTVAPVGPLVAVAALVAPLDDGSDAGSGLSVPNPRATAKPEMATVAAHTNSSGTGRFMPWCSHWPVERMSRARNADGAVSSTMGWSSGSPAWRGSGRSRGGQLGTKL